MRCASRLVRVPCRTLVAALLLTFLFSPGCHDTGTHLPPEYEGLDPSRAPSSHMLDVPQRLRVAGFCYMEALTMQVAYYRPDISRSKAFAYALLGGGVYWSDHSRVLGSLRWITGEHLHAALQNLGIPYVLGSGSRKGWAATALLDGARGILRFSDGIEALGYLKAAVADGRPVYVHLDLGYLTSDSFTFDAPPGASHFMVVKGYDPSHVYLTETIGLKDDPAFNMSKTIPVPISAFLESWLRAGDVEAGTIVQTGPFFMLVFDLPGGSTFSEAGAPGQILAEHQARARADPRWEVEAAGRM
jgi:hypothetical protein